ncbi:integrative conjugative element protein, RAQPRD family [Pseudomonas lundensis]|uniref:integrative conjugative element protein, RAQPRD family n=1 Tax=Pseudomonas lundensis TaxID=86185 RepID=UPI0039084005
MGAFTLSLLLVTPLTLASGTAQEPARLTNLLRQLDQIERQAEASARLPRDDTSRYHFDYTRFRDDVQRMRQGIRDHLSPRRAQPRDQLPLSGDYRREGEARHESE